MNLYSDERLKAVACAAQIKDNKIKTMAGENSLMCYCAELVEIYSSILTVEDIQRITDLMNDFNIDDLNAGYNILSNIRAAFELTAAEAEGIASVQRIGHARSLKIYLNDLNLLYHSNKNVVAKQSRILNLLHGSVDESNVEDVLEQLMNLRDSFELLYDIEINKLDKEGGV